MASSYTALLKFNKPALGDPGWGTAINGGYTDMVEQSLTGAVSVAVTSGGTTPVPAISDGVSSDARNQFITITGSLTSVQTATVQLPVGTSTNFKLYFVKNSAGGTVTVTTVAGTNVAVPNGASMILRVTNLGIEVAADHFVNLKASGNVSFDGGTFVFNASGADKDARFAGDNDANMLFLDASTDRVGIGTATPAAKLDVNGNALINGTLGIGTSSPTGQLHLAGANAQQIFRTDQSTSGYTYTQGLDDSGVYFSHNSSGRSFRWAPNSVTQMELSVSGNLGVGTNPSASTKLFGLSGNSQHGIYGQTQGSGDSYYGVYGITTKAANITSGGVIGISSNGTTFGILGYNDSTQQWGGYFNGNTYATGTYQGSDARLKENVQTLSGSLQKITALRPVEFDWKQDSDAGRNGFTHDVGLLAQEALPVLPNIVKEVNGANPLKDSTPSLNSQLGTFYTIDYTRLIPHLIAAVQELKTQNDELRARVAALEAK